MAKRPYPRFNAPHAAGRLAKSVYVCSQCEVHFKQEKPPVQCQYCGGIQFVKFQSITESKRWAMLRGLEKRGVIKNLSRQRWYELYAHSDRGPVIVGRYVSDFEYDDVETNDHVTEDVKPKAGVDDLAHLKMQIMRANGRPVTVYTPT